MLSIADAQKAILQVYRSKSYKSIDKTAIKFKYLVDIKVWSESIWPLIYKALIVSKPKMH